MASEFSNDAPQRLPGSDEDAAHALLDEQAAAEQFAGLSGEERRRVADLQWLHSLLQQTLRHDAVGRERRILRVCEAIRREALDQVQVATPPLRSRRWIASVLAAAALLAAVLVLRIPFVPPPTAMAAVETSLKEARSSPDRLYRIEAVIQPPVGSELRKVNARLWVRGETHYVLQHDGLLGGLALGSNGREHWLVPPIGPVIVGNDPGVVQSRLLNSPLAVPFVQVTAILESLADRYELTLAPEQDLPAVDGHGTVRCAHVIGRKRAGSAARLPDIIELWTTRQTGTAYRVDARWHADAQLTGPREIRLQWTAMDGPLPSDWYDHAAHHAPDRTVMRRMGDDSLTNEG